MYLLTRNFSDIFDKNLKYLFNILLKNGDEARLVGGCVRNYILGVKIDDYDIATIYTPDEVENLLRKNSIDYFSIGKEFGTITALVRGKKYEITTLRKDIKTDGRHAVVEFTKDYKEDAARRDFTFNALYIDFNGKLYDYFGGVNDLFENNIKFIGNPENRILEDNLRILRFFRFYGLYCFGRDENSILQCVKYKDKIKNLSIERVSNEFYKILNSNYPIAILKNMQYYGILEEIFDGLLDFSSMEIFYSIAEYIEFNYNHIFVLALLLSKNKVNYKLFLTKKEKKYVDTILSNMPQKLDVLNIKKLLVKVGDKITVKAIVVIFICNNFCNFVIAKKFINYVDKLKTPVLDITGNDLIKNSFKDFRNYSKILSEAKNIFIESKFKYKKSKILKILKKKYCKNHII